MPHPTRTRLHLAVTLATLLALLAYDASPLDMLLARPFGTSQGFPLHDHWLLDDVLHDGGRRVSWAAAMALTLCVWWPVGVLRRLAQRERVQLIVVALLSVLLVSVLKSFSRTSCPWELADFGGAARHLSHWNPLRDGGSGHCFPGGHASSGFAFVGGYFVLRQHAPRAALAWLVMSLSAGLLLGIAQQARGAHFMSHTLWTAWLCWTAAFVGDAALRVRWVPASAGTTHVPSPRPRPGPAGARTRSVS
jgi:membrane-associated PAP2 superfamily phosphatase